MSSHPEASPPPGRKGEYDNGTGFRGMRGTRVLRSAGDLTAYQRAWFADLKDRAARGEPVALVNADAPQEIFRAMDIPYVVNQWWASVVAAKQKSADYLRLLRERGYPDTLDQYSALALGSSFEVDPASAPWGGLPKPSIVHAIATGNSMRKLFELWALEHGAAVYLIEKTIGTEGSPYPYWWERIDDEWEELIGPERLDLMVDELKGLIRFLEQITGKGFSETRFKRVMDLTNEQASYFRRARDLIARTVPAPVTIVDTMPATMVPQWQRGTEWARDAARAFYEEVKRRVDHGEAACENEQVRLMWLGRGLWFNLGFYQHFQERYGAVFVWSMYLGLAADGYIRRGPDPLRALAARFATMGDELRMPTWASEWHLKEARLHQIDGVVSLEPGAFFSIRALERAGIPVLTLDADNVDARQWDEAAIRAQVADFIERRVLPVARRRGA